MTHKTNNFNLLRLFFSIAVVFSHSGPMVGHPEPVFWLHSLGSFSVHGFFAISGYLIAQSYVRTPNIWVFSVNRALRILPGLILALVFGRIVWSLCDQFSNIPLEHSRNGPLWTLTWEVACYVACGLLGLVGVLTKRLFPAFFASAWLLYLCNLSSQSDTYMIPASIMTLFLTGSFIAIMEKDINVPKAAFVASIVLFILFFPPATHLLFFVINEIPFAYGTHVTEWQIHEVPYLMSMPFVIIYFGAYAKTLVDIRDDLSYGIYIFGWPIAQAIVWLCWKYGHSLNNQFLLFAMTMPALLLVSFASWRLVERPALRLKLIFRSKITAIPQPLAVQDMRHNP